MHTKEEEEKPKNPIYANLGKVIRWIQKKHQERSKKVEIKDEKTMKAKVIILLIKKWNTRHSLVGARKW